MGNKLARFFITLMGLFVGPGLTILVFELLRWLDVIDLYTALLQWGIFLIFVSAALISGIIFFFLSRPIVNTLYKMTVNIEKQLSKLPTNTLFSPPSWGWCSA